MKTLITICLLSSVVSSIAASANIESARIQETSFAQTCRIASVAGDRIETEDEAIERSKSCSERKAIFGCQSQGFRDCEISSWHVIESGKGYCTSEATAIGTQKYPLTIAEKMDEIYVGKAQINEISDEKLKLSDGSGQCLVWFKAPGRVAVYLTSLATRKQVRPYYGSITEPFENNLFQFTKDGDLVTYRQRDGVPFFWSMKYDIKFDLPTHKLIQVDYKFDSIWQQDIDMSCVDLVKVEPKLN